MVDALLIREALKLPDDFSYGGDLPLGETWSLGPMITTRDDRDLLQQTNVAALLATLKEHPEFNRDWEIVTADHWGCGWVEHLAFRAVDEKGEPTAIFQFLADWNDRLSEDPCADDEDYSRRQYEAALEAIEWISTDAPAAEIFRWLWDHTDLDTETDGHYLIYEAEVRKACIGLGYVTKEDR